MHRKAIPFIPNPSLLLWVTAGHMILGLAAFAAWQVTSRLVWLRCYFDYEGVLFFLFMAGCEFGLSFRAWRVFSPGEPLRGAWQLICIGSAYRLTGSIFAKLLSARSYLNPIYAFGESVDKSTALALRQFGTIVGGPLQMAALAGGLLIVLRVNRKLGLSGRLKRADMVLLALVMAFTLRQLFEIASWMKAGGSYSLFKALNWLSDPLLSILLLEAVFIRRSVVQMGWGLISKCWGSFITAVFLTSLGNILVWAEWHEYISWPLTSITWYVWFPAAAAFALGPAYQVEAVQKAIQESPDLVPKPGLEIRPPGH